MSPPPPFRPKLPPAMAAAIDRAVEIYRALMREHNAGRGRVHRDVLENLDLARRELVLLADTLGKHPPDIETARAVQALAEAATELAKACQAALTGRKAA